MVTKLSFCITCMNRFWQIKTTLTQNLKDNYLDKEIIEFILVDFNSNDGLKEFVLSECQQELSEGYLKYYFIDKLDTWNASITRNTSHILGNGEILINLDADNFTGYRGGKFIIDIFEQNDKKVFIHQWCGEYRKGDYGRIGYYKKDFFNLGGYNQDFYPMGYLDTDLINRFIASGFTMLNIRDKEYNRAIPNNKNNSIQNCDGNMSWRKMNMYNLLLSQKNIITNNLIANKDKEIGIRVDESEVKDKEDELLVEKNVANDVNNKQPNFLSKMFFLFNR